MHHRVPPLNFFRVIFCFIKKIGISYKVLLQFHDTGIYHNVWRNIMLPQLMLLRSIIFWGLNQPTSSRSKIPSSSIVSILHTLMAFYVTYQCDRIIKCQFTEKYHFAKFWISFGKVFLYKLTLTSFVKLQNFKFEHIASSSFFHFSSLISSLETIFLSFGPNISRMSHFIEFELALHTNHPARVWSSLEL